MIDIQDRNIVMIGAGQLGQMALNIWPSSCPKPTLFLDTYKRGSLNNIPIESLPDHRPSSDNLYVLSFFKQSAAEIIDLFEHKFRQDIVTVYDILTQFSAETFSNGWQGDETDGVKLLAQGSPFSDAHSDQAYISAVLWRYFRHLTKDYPVKPEADKYNLALIDTILPNYDLVIDGGSFDLSFHKAIQTAKINYKNYLAIEADPSRMAVIQRVDDQNIIFEPRALWDKITGVNFFNNGQLSARIAPDHPVDQNYITIPTITLSHMIAHYQPKTVLIKLHIEGAESYVVQEVLPHILDIQHVSFSINLSHDEVSLIEIPLLLKHHGFSIRLHSHSLFGEGLTLYATRTVL